MKLQCCPFCCFLLYCPLCRFLFFSSINTSESSKSLPSTTLHINDQTPFQTPFPVSFHHSHNPKYRLFQPPPDEHRSHHSLLAVLSRLSSQDAPIFASHQPQVWLQNRITNLQLQGRISVGVVTEKAKVEFLEAAARVE
ncbi:hypothetical protein Hdeb2414_s0024g00652031 [Helianthus debilis subsp. tardiflorus]